MVDNLSAFLDLSVFLVIFLQPRNFSAYILIIDKYHYKRTVTKEDFRHICVVHTMATLYVYQAARGKIINTGILLGKILFCGDQNLFKKLRGDKLKWGE